MKLMKVKAAYIVKLASDKYQTLYETENGKYFITSNGAFGQRDMSLEPIPILDAKELLDEIE